MIDTHAHLDFENFDEDREEVISRFFEQGGKAIVNIGVDLETSKKSIKLAEKHENIFAAVGLHPECFSEGDRGDDLKKLAVNEKVVAVGECGLDYFRIGESGEIKERQKKGFLAQIELAQELNLPVIVHCRNAWNDLFEIVSEFLRLNLKNQKFVLHCYSGNKNDTEKFLKLPNVFFSFSGNITYPPRKSPSRSPFNKEGEVEDVIRMIPLDRIMLDSDSPFLAPQAVRGKRNEPSFSRYIAEKIAEIKEISGEEVERMTDENAEKFFGI